MFIKQQLQIDLFFFLASRDVVRNVKIAEFNDNSLPGLVNSKSFQYQISWRPPIQPNGLIYFYMIYIAQNSNNGPKQESCVGNDIRSINVTLSPRTHYRLRIITYTVARLNNEYKDREQIQDESFSSNGTYLFYEEIFITKDLQSRKEKFNLIFSIFFCLRVSGDITRQSRSVFFILIIGSIIINYYCRCTVLLLQIRTRNNQSIDLKKSELWFVCFFNFEIDREDLRLFRIVHAGSMGNR